MDREQRLAAAKKKLNIYKQQQQQQQNTNQAQPRRLSNTGNEPSTSSSSASSHIGQFSPGIQAQTSPASSFNGSNGNHNHEPVNSDNNRIALARHEEAPQAQAHFPAGIDSPPLAPLLLPLDVPPQQLDLLDSNPLLPHPTAHFDLLDSNTLPQHSLAQSSPGPSSSNVASAMPGRDIAETHQHQQQRRSSSGSNQQVGHLINHDIVADINASYHNYNNGNGLMTFANSGLSTLPDVASDAPAPAAVTPGLIEDSQLQLSPPSQREMEQDLVNRVNQQSTSASTAATAPPPDNDLVATARASAFNQNHDHGHFSRADQTHLHAAEPSTSSAARPGNANASRSSNPINLYPTPTFRRGHQSGGSASSSVSGMDDPAAAAASAITTEVYELQLSQLRADNVHLQQRETDLVTQLQQVELTIQALRKERDELRQELRAEDTPSLKSKLSTLYEENAMLKEQVRTLELQLEAANENVTNKVGSYNELEQALIVINKGKMELAAKLDVELEASKELRDRFEESQHQLEKLSQRNIELESILSSHQLQLERLSSLEAEMVLMKKRYSEAAGGVNHHEHERHDHNHSYSHETHSDHQHDHEHNSDHEHGAHCNHDHDDDHGHDHDHHRHNNGDDGHSHHGPTHEHHDHDEHEHGHDHDHSHGEEHHHHDDVHAEHPHEDLKSLSAMEKKLARLEWENASFREEIDRLAELLRTKTVDANLLANYQEDNERLKRNLGQAEHLVVQLSSENETIGDYIALYQTQRLALKERAREKENELATLSIEREKLRAQMEQLNQLLQAYHCKLEEGTAAGEIESNAKQINDLVLGINSTFHPCSVCSGSRLMNV